MAVSDTRREEFKWRQYVEANLGGGGSSTLAGLTDVDLTTNPVQDHSLLWYDLGGNTWFPTADGQSTAQLFFDQSTFVIQESGLVTADILRLVADDTTTNLTVRFEANQWVLRSEVSGDDLVATVEGLTDVFAVKHNAETGTEPGFAVQSGDMFLRSDSTASPALGNAPQYFIQFLNRTGSQSAILGPQASDENFLFQYDVEAGAIDFFVTRQGSPGVLTQIAEFNPHTGCHFYHSEQFTAGEETVRTEFSSAGGLEVNNQATGAGFERVLTVSDLGGAAPSTLALAADNADTSTSTTVADDNDLTGFVLAANQTYAFDAYIRFSAPGPTGARWNFQIAAGGFDYSVYSWLGIANDARGSTALL